MGIPDMDKSLNKTDPGQNALVRIQILCPLPTLPDNLKPLLGRKDVQCSWVPSMDQAQQHNLIEQFDLAVFFPGKTGDVEQKRQMGQLLQAAQRKNVPVMLLTEDRSLANLVPADNDRVLSRIQVASPDIITEELWGRLCAMLDFSPMFNRIEQYMGHMEKWAFALNNRFEELHQELRLAWRVQQDFLPKRLPKMPTLEYAALYRPASWVSGDIYDIFQLDERHMGFYIADVVGHGVAAGLMTLFVKRALVTKEIHGRHYQILSPDQAMARLNADLASLELSEHQFVTACYGVIDTQTRRLEMARAGHPLPILINSDGAAQRLQAEGSLLGVFPDAQFPKTQADLAPGMKLVLLTDGLEQAFGEDESEKKMTEQIIKLSRLPVQQMIDTLSAVIDCQENSLHPADDITVLAIEAVR